MPPLRLRLRVTGLVQGVGFRPFVFRRAEQDGLTGWVTNTSNGVRIEVQGPAEPVGRFAERLRAEARPPIRIDAVECAEAAWVEGEAEFRIRPSEESPGATAAIPADLAICDACRAETLDEPGRRRGYAFTNCTFCGPRFTIIRAVPYDRPATTMAGFPLCDACRAEYADPRDRRYHAQPIACPRCGPRLVWRDARGALLPEPDPAAAAARLRAGGIVALKGIGGFLLAADAASPKAATALRRRKRRGNKPFALMAADLETARRAVRLDAAEAEALASPAAPIVLLPRRPEAPVAPDVAPDADTLGVMLPYSPLHLLLFAAGAPRLLVMTSGNRRDEPICLGEEAFERLAGIADAFLDHDRPIRNRCDDSVGFVHRGRFRLVRRARGFVPDPIPLPFAAPPALGVGPLLKNTLCLAEGDRAVVSQHIGDADTVEALDFHAEVRRNLEEWLRITPRVVGHDLHPGYPTTAAALRLGLPAVAVQHHHAHAAAALAEAGLPGPAVALTLDGTGLGPDGVIWGGEILVADYARFRRVARLRDLPLPGGDAAIHEPIRTLLAWAAALRIDLPTDHLPALAQAPDPLPAVVRAAARLPGTVRTTSAGRLFDAVAVLLGAPGLATFEAEAAIRLETQARRAQAAADLPAWESTRDAEGIRVLDPAPLLRRIADRVAAGADQAERSALALAFHHSTARTFADAAADAAREAGLRDLVLGGGVFQNRLLLDAVADRLDAAGLRLHLPGTRLPPNDAAVSLGQALVAARRTLDP